MRENQDTDQNDQALSKNETDFEDVLFESMRRERFGKLVNVPVLPSIGYAEALASVLEATNRFVTRRRLREWWHNLLRGQGRYPCYAIFLVLPSDKDAIAYLTDFGKELDLVSSDKCLVIALGKAMVRRSGFDEGVWRPAIKRYASEGHSVVVARLFSIPFTEFPCLILFEDIRSSRHVIITLGGMTTEEIAEKIRFVFSVVQEAISEGQEPLAALQVNRNHRKLHNAGQAIVSAIRSFAGKTFETAVEAWIKSALK